MNALKEQEQIRTKDFTAKEHSVRLTAKSRKTTKNGAAQPSFTDQTTNLASKAALTIMYTNADQLTTSKKSELLHLIERKKPLVIAICEMKPKNHSERTQLDYTLPGYALYPINIDSGSSVGRGIAVYIHPSIDKSVIQIETDVRFSETCLLEVKLLGGDILLFGCFYRSPTPSDTSDENNANLNRLLRSLTVKRYTHICFVGDFNYRDINWLSWTTSHNEESKEANFIETLRDCYLYQHLQEPTRSRGSDDPSLIDLILTNESMQVSDIQYHAPLGKSDHCVITFNYHCYIDYSKPKERFVYQKADFDSMRNHLALSRWSEEFLLRNQNMSVDDLWNSFKSKILELRNKFVPKQLCGMPSWKMKGSVPINQDLRDAIRSKSSLHRRWISSRNRPDAEIARKTYTRARNKVKAMMRKSKREFEKNIGAQSISNPKIFWSHVRSKLKTKSGVAPLLQDVTDKTSTKFDDKEKANILQKQFVSVFTKEPNDDVPVLGKKTEAILSCTQVTYEMVRKKILKLNVNKSCGPDEMHPRVLIELVDHITKPLALLLNKTMDDGCIPEDWKMAYVSPIFKKGARNKAENYRPISLTSIVCKLIESFIKESIMDHMRAGNLLSSKQYGFTNGRSTTTQLLSYLDKCIETIVAGGVVDAIYFDFAKAFDSVPHQRLLGKLTSYGINGKILKWIRTFLSDRCQIVKVNGMKSDPASVLSGIPQGSVLGPVLFIIYINDLPEVVKSDTYLFADDTKILRQITTKEDALQLQSDINSLELWSQKWLLTFHPQKCSVLTLGRFQNITHTQRYTLHQQELEHVFEQRDLGVILDADLKFAEHISAKIKKANTLIGLIRRSFSYLDGPLFKKLFTTFVRPHLEYSQAIWAPHLKRYVNMLENVQRRATKLVDGFHRLDYSERLKRLNLPSLAYRRARGDMIEIFKHFHTYDKLTLSENFKPRNRLSRKHNYQLVWKAPKDGVRGLQSNSFYFRTVKTWNELPREVVHAGNIDVFKIKLDDAWKSLPIKFYDQSDS